MNLDNIPIKDFSRTACVLSKDESLSEALRAMKKCKSDRIILKSKTEDIAGIATKFDITMKLATERTRRTEPSSWRISGFMSYPVLTIGQNKSVRVAVEIMWKNKFSSLPILDSDVQIFDKFSIAELLVDNKTNVLEISRTPPITLRLSDRILHARMKIAESNISFLPAIGDDGDFRGVIGIDEILDILTEYYETSRKTPKHLTEISYLVVGDAIKQRPPTVGAGDAVGEAASLMLKNGYRGVVVLDNSGKPVGLITGQELIGYLRRMGGNLIPPNSINRRV
ncbi:MAG: CBS domain-containing protein [Desulfurococcales archaeon]|nr:CBS domain-containing protein [Desulfurococcales archaeon]